MSFATSQPIVDRYIGAVGAASAIRAHLLSNVPNRKAEKSRTIANAVRAAGLRIHPVRLAAIIRRTNSFVQDLVN